MSLSRHRPHAAPRSAADASRPGPRAAVGVVVALVLALTALVMVAAVPAGATTPTPASLKLPPGVAGEAAVRSLLAAPVTGQTGRTRGTVFLQDGFESGLDYWTQDVWTTATSDATFDVTTYRAKAGSYSVYGVGTLKTAPGPYPPGVDSMLYAGPFDLSGTSTAYLDFDLWNSVGNDGDYAGCYFSRDLDGAWGWMWGTTSGWEHQCIDLAAIPGDNGGTIDFTGGDVYIVFGFTSDGSTSGEGAYFDQARLATDPLVPIPPPATVRYQESNSKLRYAGAWSIARSSQFSGGAQKILASRGAALVQFKGAAVSVIATKGPKWGKVRVTLDGKSLGLIDLYSRTTRYRQKILTRSGLSAGASHALVLEYSGRKNAASGSAKVNVDAFDVAGTLQQAPPKTGGLVGSWSSDTWHLTFRSDGTYRDIESLIGDYPGAWDGTAIRRGRYYAMGGVMNMYGITETWIPSDPNDKYHPPYENKRVKDERTTYVLAADGQSFEMDAFTYTRD